MQHFMGAYTAVHNYLTSQKVNSGGIGGAHRGVHLPGEELYHRFAGYLKKALTNMREQAALMPKAARVNSGGIGGAHRGLHLLGEELYHRFASYLKEALTNMREQAALMPKSKLLDAYNERWDHLWLSGKMATYIFRYLQRHYIKREIDEGKRHVYSIMDLILREWRVAMLDSMEVDLTTALLDLLQRQRNGEYIEQLPRKNFIQSVSKSHALDACTTLLITPAYTCHLKLVSLGQAWDFTEHQAESSLTENTLAQHWQSILRSSTVDHYKKVSAEDLACCTDKEYIESVG
jgi:hypothetical protein